MVFGLVAPGGSHVGVYQHFRGTYTPPPSYTLRLEAMCYCESLVNISRLHGIRIQEVAIHMFTAVKASRFFCKLSQIRGALWHVSAATVFVVGSVVGRYILG